MKHLVLVNAESVLGLVHETLLRAAMNGLVLTAAELVADGLSIGLAGVWLRATSDLVGRSGDAFLGLVEGRFGGVGSLGNPTLVLFQRFLKKREHTIFSPALVWKSFLNASDMLKVIWVDFGNWLCR
jgi:hypothetical protein